jgi:hypothetical protein
MAGRGGGTGAAGGAGGGATGIGIGIGIDTGGGGGLAIDTGGGTAALPGRGKPVLWLVPQYGQYSTLRGNARAQAPFTHR